MRPHWFGMLGILLGTACSRISSSAREEKETPPAPSSSAHSDEHEELPRKVRLTDKVATDSQIRTAPVVRESLRVTLTLPGEIVSDPDRSARISAPIAGRIERVTFREGSTVKKGDIVAVIRVPELGKVRAAYAATMAGAKAARSNANRLKELLAQRLAPEQEVLDADAAARSLEVEAESLGAQLGAMGAGKSGSDHELALRAPITGVVITRDAVVGQPVTADETIGYVADLSEVWFLGRVFEKDLGRVRLQARTEVELNAYPKEPFDGVVEQIGRQVDPVARTLTARIRLQNRNDLLRIGLFGTARVSTGESEPHPPALVVPREALTEIAGKSVVFVRQPDGEFELHDVSVGDAALGKVEILSGLRDGEEVVVGGVFTLKSIVLKSAIAEDE